MFLKITNEAKKFERSEWGSEDSGGSILIIALEGVFSPGFIGEK